MDKRTRTNSCLKKYLLCSLLPFLLFAKQVFAYSTQVGVGASEQYTTLQSVNLAGNLIFTAATYSFDTGGRIFLGDLTNEYISFPTGDNLFIGYHGNGNLTFTSADSNNCIGVNTGLALTTGDDNVFLGENAGRLVTTGNRNVAISEGALDSLITGSDNVGIGYWALTASTAGLWNVALGANAGAALISVSASSNTFIGSNTGLLNTGAGNVFLGYYAGGQETGSGKLYIHNSNTISPLVYGDFSTGEIGHYHTTYDFFTSTASGGTKYVEFTPSSATFRQTLITTGNNTLGDSNADTMTINGEVTMSSDTAITGGTLQVSNTANTDYSLKVIGNDAYGSVAWGGSDGVMRGIFSHDTTQVGLASLGNNDLRILASGTGDIFAQLDSNSNFNVSTGQGVHVSTFSYTGTIETNGAMLIGRHSNPNGNISSLGIGTLCIDLTAPDVCMSTHATNNTSWVQTKNTSVRCN